MFAYVDNGIVRDIFKENINSKFCFEFDENNNLVNIGDSVLTDDTDVSTLETKPRWEINNGKLVSFWSDEEIEKNQTKKLIKKYEATIQQHLDNKAQERGWDNIFTACLDAGHSIATNYKEGKAYLDFKGKVWDFAFKYLNNVVAKKTKLLTIDALIKKLPTIESSFKSQGLKYKITSLKL